MIIMQFVIFIFLFVTIKCDENSTISSVATATEKISTTTDEVNSTTIFSNETTTEVTEEIEFIPDNYEAVTVPGEHLGTFGIYGGFYPDPNASNPFDWHFVHGTLQPLKEFYYSAYATVPGEEGNWTMLALDYYLSHGLSKINNTDFNYTDYHHCDKKNRTIQSEEKLPSDIIIACHGTVSSFCPENTENLCLLNGTIYCVSKVNVTYSCSENGTICIDTTVPCVGNCKFGQGYVEIVSVKCLSILEIIDVYDFGDGTTLAKVSGTFVIVPVLNVEERTFCISVVSDPEPPEPTI